jgi:hypothetical protein
MSVCEVVESLDALSGTLIAVRGEYYFSRETSAVGQATCPTILQLQGRKWPNAISLAASQPKPNLRQTSYTQLREFLARATRLLTDLYGTGRNANLRPQVTLTVVGVLHTRTPEYFAAHGPLGFGHLNAYPAELEVLGVRDVTISAVPASGNQR